MMGQSRESNMNNRAESVPPSVQGLLTTSNGNASNLMHPQQQQLHGINNHGPYMRAQSEQPQFFGSSGTSTANFGNAPQTPLSPTSMYPMYNNQQSMLMRNGNGQQQHHQQHQQMQAKALNNMTNNLSNNRIARVTGNVQIPHMQGGGGGGTAGNGASLIRQQYLELEPAHQQQQQSELKRESRPLAAAPSSLCQHALAHAEQSGGAGQQGQQLLGQLPKVKTMMLMDEES